MAIRLKGTLSTLTGATEESYIRIEYAQYRPFDGTIAYNPILYKNTLSADMSKIQYYGQELPQEKFLSPSVSMSLESGSLEADVAFDDIIILPLSGAAQEITINHYANTLHSMSVEITDFDEDGNEVITNDFTYWNEYGIASQSLETRNPIDLSRTGSLLEQCYDHFKGILTEQIPAENILDI